MGTTIGTGEDQLQGSPRGNKDAKTRTAAFLALAVPYEQVQGATFVALHYPLEFRRVDGVARRKGVAFVADYKVEVGLDCCFRGWGRGGDAENMEGAWRSLGCRGLACTHPFSGRDGSNFRHGARGEQHSQS